MTVSHRIDSQTLAGSLGGHVGSDIAFATVSGSFRMTRLDLRLTDAPSGGTVAAMVNTVAGGGGSALPQGTILDTTNYLTVTGDVSFSGTTTFYLRITAESGSAMGLSASLEISIPGGAPVTVFLSSLQNVKDSAKITGSSNDAILTRHLEGVSKSMQKWMARDIVQTVTTVERHHPSGLADGLVLDGSPIVSVQAVRSGGVVLASDTYRAEAGGILRRVSSGYRTKWASGLEIEVDYTAGYTTVPADLIEACTQETVRHWFQSKAGGGAGAHVNAQTPETGDTKTLESAGFMPQTIVAMSPYRKMV